MFYLLTTARFSPHIAKRTRTTRLSKCIRNVSAVASIFLYRRACQQAKGKTIVNIYRNIDEQQHLRTHS